MTNPKLDRTEIPNHWTSAKLWHDVHLLCKRIYGFLRLNILAGIKGVEHILQYGIGHSTTVRRWHIFIQKKRREHEERLAFLKAWIENPLTMGAVTPSSYHLAHEMASHCDITRPGIIVELGAGTGVVTSALLQSGISYERLVVVEYSPALASKLRQHFPNVCVIEGNAGDLAMLLKDESRPICSIVSSLPLRSLPPSLTEAVLEQITTLLPPQSKYIQFTYSFRKNHYPALSGYRQIASKRIWRNLPPARVDVWEAD
jgi:phosphatidylethanolamine/phosphatidyl-N-methylethanolamine N-methyltransferase